ncbi:MAG: type II toxin-antitoxin system HicB family antitoxin [Vulcanimicrobiota bacterium]
MKYAARYEKESENMYFCKFIDFPNAFTQGDTMEELSEMARDVLSLVLEDYLDDEREFPAPTQVEGEDILWAEPYPEIYIKYPARLEKIEKSYTCRFIDFPDLVAQGKRLDKLKKKACSILNREIKHRAYNDIGIPKSSTIEGDDIIWIRPDLLFSMMIGGYRPGKKK